MAACRGKEPHILADFNHGGPLSEMLMLGNIATRFPGQSLQYDPSTGRITNFDEANAFLGYDYRKGWAV